MNPLIDAIKNEVNGALTENGAVTHESTFSNLLDFFYHAPAKRGQDNTGLFRLALAEDKVLALKALCYIRDIRGGQGERETFRQGLRELNSNFPDLFEAMIPLVQVYGRWDDLLEFVGNPRVVTLVSNQLADDLRSMVKGESMSLLGKWMPSVNTSSKATKTLANKWVKGLGLTPKDYRQMLSKLRAALNVVEVQMSSQTWGTIDYSHVPSKANLKYKTAFYKQDGPRYAEFIAKAANGEAKINSGTLYPYDLVTPYLHGYKQDSTVEALWKQLPNYAETPTNALVVCDTSGSMFSGGKPRPIEVAISLAVYIAERNTGPFKNHFLTFSSAPQLAQLQGDSLWERVTNLATANWGMSTDIQAVFDLILKSAIQNSVSKVDMPETIFIVSDMEFNECAEVTNFEAIKAKYTESGYELPKLVFWNVASRGKQTPVTQDEVGTFLVSGCSPSIFGKAINMSASTPMGLMLEVLNGPRYDEVTKYMVTGCR